MMSEVGEHKNDKMATSRAPSSDKTRKTIAHNLNKKKNIIERKKKAHHY